MKYIRASIRPIFSCLIAMLCVGLGQIAAAQNNNLASFESLDSTTKVTGEIIAFDGRTYTVRTPLGELVLEADQVICTGAACPNQAQINTGYRIAGTSDVMQSLIGELIMGYGFDAGAEVLRSVDEAGLSVFALTTDVATAPRTISLAPGSTEASFKAMLDGSADFVVADREPNARELSLLKLGGQGDLGSADTATIIALEPIEFIVAPDNPVRRIAEDDIARVLSGKISSWAELGGADTQINLYLADNVSGTSKVIEDVILKPARASLDANLTLLTSTQEVADVVAQDAAGFGVVGQGGLRNARALSIDGVCGLPMATDPFSLKSGEYPFVRAIRAYRPETLNSTGANDLWRYLRSDAASDLIDRAGFADLSVERRGIDNMGRRFASAIAEPQAEVTIQGLQAMMSALNGAERLSTTFRFQSGSLDLDERSRRDLSRLLRNLARADLKGRKLILAGFTSSVGVADRNLAMSSARADLVRETLLDLSSDAISPTDVSAFGFGELAPLACNDSEIGRKINQRVEVWVR